MTIAFKASHFERDVILWGARWYVAYPLSYRQIAWKYLYRAVDKAGATVDFLLTARRDRKAALRFLRKAIGRQGVPEKITIDKSGANTAAIISYNANHDADRRDPPGQVSQQYR